MPCKPLSPLRFSDPPPERYPPPPPTSSKKPYNRLGRTQKCERVKDLKAAASGDFDLLMATAASVAKEFNMNYHFVLKKLKENPELAKDLKRYIEKDYSMYLVLKNQSCMYLYLT